MYSSPKSVHQRLVGCLFLGLSVLLIAACGGKPSLTGKWEQVSGAGVGVGAVGQVWEFFNDGTVNVTGVAAKYSWPDSNHLKIDLFGGYGIVEQFSLAGDVMTLKDSQTQQSAILKRYKELTPSLQVMAGTWQSSNPDESKCFSSMGLDMTPAHMTLGTDGRFSVKEDASLLSTALALNGKVSLTGARLHIDASGTRDNPGFLGFGASQDKVGGSLDCTVVVSLSRLVLTNSQGKITLFTRPGL